MAILGNYQLLHLYRVAKTFKNNLELLKKNEISIFMQIHEILKIDLCDVLTYYIKCFNNITEIIIILGLIVYVF